MVEMKEQMTTMHTKLNEVSQLASQGKTSLKTLLWVGGAAAAIVAFVATAINILPK